MKNVLKIKLKDLQIKEKNAFQTIKEIIKANKKDKKYDFTFIRYQMKYLIQSIKSEKKEIENMKNQF